MAGVPDDIEFTTKPALAADMLTRALRAGASARPSFVGFTPGMDPP